MKKLHTKKRRINSKKGISMVLAIALAAVLFLSTTTFLSIAMLQQKETGTTMNSRQAYVSAKSALDIAEELLNDGKLSLPDSGSLYYVFYYVEVLVKPERFEDASTIADHLNNKRTVVLNLESTNKEVSRRLVDFLSGVAYANNGQIKRVANSTFIITPYNVDIMGDLLDELENNGAFY